MVCKPDGRWPEMISGADWASSFHLTRSGQFAQRVLRLVEFSGDLPSAEGERGLGAGTVSRFPAGRPVLTLRFGDRPGPWTTLAAQSGVSALTAMRQSDCYEMTAGWHWMSWGWKENAAVRLE
jgi:hypothetical protein